MPIHKQPADLSSSAPRPDYDQEGVAVTHSPTGDVVIPTWMVPYFLAGAGALAIVGDEVANPAPWTPARGLGLAVKLLGYFGLGATQGLRRK